MPYRNFRTAVFFVSHTLADINDFQEFEKDFMFLEKHVSVDKVYLETYRTNVFTDREKILAAKAFFEKKGIAVSGAFTTNRIPLKKDVWDFRGFCYSDPSQADELKKVARYSAGLFDEIILDDFFFFNCKCGRCIDAKGSMTWTDYRLKVMQAMTEILVAEARAENPSVKIVIKYPNWYDDYHAAGYDPEKQPNIADLIYTGTETRNPAYTQQELPRYTGYFIMRYLENAAPGKNNGGWFDTFDATYNPASFAEQAYLTLFAKAREITLFTFNLLVGRDSQFTPAAGYAFEKADTFLQKLGNPSGIACYKPFHSDGENYLHGYLGMCGLPLEPSPFWPEKAPVVFLTESAKKDDGIIDKIKNHLCAGNNVIITSGLLEALQGRGFGDIAEIEYTQRRASIKEFGYLLRECSYRYYQRPEKEILVPQLRFHTNDATQLVAGFSGDAVFPVFLEVQYGNGYLFILAVPDNPADLYHFPEGVLNYVRRFFLKGFRIGIESAARIGLFMYDNNTCIVESFLPHSQDVRLVLHDQNSKLFDLETGSEMKCTDCNGTIVFEFSLHASMFRVFGVQ